MLHAISSILSGHKDILSQPHLTINGSWKKKNQSLLSSFRKSNCGCSGHCINPVINISQSFVFHLRISSMPGGGWELVKLFRKITTLMQFYVIITKVISKPLKVTKIRSKKNRSCLLATSRYSRLSIFSGRLE